MTTINKVVRIGDRTFCEIKFDGKRLSITGVIKPMRQGGCEACGQIYDEIKDVKEYAPGWTQGMAEKFVKVWQRWHLNDMNAGCEHQRKNWDTDKQVTLVKYTWTSKYHQARKNAVDGEMSMEEYAAFKDISRQVLDNTIGINSPKYETAEIKELLKGGWIEAKDTEVKSAGWVNYMEHPDGILRKPCKVCGYKYGTKWLHEDVPEDVINWLNNLPDTDEIPAWV